MTSDIDINNGKVDLLPCSFWMLAAGAFSIPFSIALGSLFLGLSMLFFILSSIIKTRLPTLNMVSISAIALGVFGVSSYFWSINPAETLHDIDTFMWLFLIIISANVASSTGRLTILLKALAFGCVTLSVYNIIRNPILAHLSVQRNDPGCPDFLTALISKGSMTYSQILIAGIVISMAFILINRNDRKSAVIWFTLTLIQTAGLIINFKRGAWFCAIIIIMLFAVSRLKKTHLIILMLAVAGLFMLPPVQSRLSTLKEEFSIEKGGRAMMWLDIAPKLHKEYTAGIGFGALTNEMMKQINPKVEPKRDHLHSNLVNIVVDLGWTGALLYLLMVTAGIYTAFKNSNRLKTSDSTASQLLFALALAQTGLFLNGLVEYNFGDSEVLIVYCIVAGAAAAQKIKPDRL